MAMVSVLMPVFNVENYLIESIDSILNQTYKDFTFYIINDGSNDRSEEIILKYKDSRIKYIKNSINQGYIKCLNQAIDLVDSKYIIRMDSDDIAMPHRIEKQVVYMEAHPTVVVCGSSRINFYPESHRGEDYMEAITDKTKLFVNSIFNTSLHHPSVIIRTEVLKKNNLRYKEIFYFAEDKALWLDLSTYGELANIKEPLLRYRIHYNQVSYTHFEEQKNNSVKRTFDFLIKLGIKLDKRDLPLLLILCYERKCDSTHEIELLEKLIFRIMRDAKVQNLDYYPELCTNLKRRFKISILKSSRIGAKVLLQIKKSKLLTFNQLDFMFYVKVGVRTFGKFEINSYKKQS